MKKGRVAKAQPLRGGLLFDFFPQGFADKPLLQGRR